MIPSPVRVVLLLARKEVRDALRNRWFVTFSLAFAALALALSRLSLEGADVAGFAGFGRTAASLINLVILIVPLMGLTLGASSLAGERERGTMATLMAQPVTRTQVLAGKYAGLALALCAALALGFGLAAAYVAAGGGAVTAAALGALVGLAMLLALASLAIGLLISAFSRRTAAAYGTALIAWLALVFLGDLGLMGTAMAMRLDVGTLLALALANPVEAFKVGAVQAITGSLDGLGPAGTYASRALGAALAPALVAALAAWAVLALGAAAARFRTGRLD